jgi:hypothetical protein
MYSLKEKLNILSSSPNSLALMFNSLLSRHIFFDILTDSKN